MYTGKLHGKGTLVYADGTTIECEFEHGEYVVPSSHHINDSIHDKQPFSEEEVQQPQLDDDVNHGHDDTAIGASKLQNENLQLQPSTAVLSGKQCRRVKKSREVETAGYTPLNLSLLSDSDNIELGKKRDRVILMPHQYS
jgi:hypothetical protein